MAMKYESAMKTSSSRASKRDPTWNSYLNSSNPHVPFEPYYKNIRLREPKDFEGIMSSVGLFRSS